MPKRLLMGNEAFAWAALTAGVRVVAGYPGTPSSELIETVARLHRDGIARGVHVEWSTNEKAALELLAGAAYTGARTLFTCKQVGLNVASDALMSLNYVGVKGGMVLYVADDPGPISSQTEQDTRRFASFAKVPVLDPSTPEQGFAMMRWAFELSEHYQTPVIVRPTTRICHSSTFFDVPDHTDARPVPDEGFVKDKRWVIFPRRSYQAHGEINDRLPRIADDMAQSDFNPITTVGTAPHLGIVCGGVSTAYAREALRLIKQRCSDAGCGLPSYRFIQVGTTYPFPQQAIEPALDGIDEVIVFEELDHVIEDELQRLCGCTHASYNVHGRLDRTTRDRGENSVDDCLQRLVSFLGLPGSFATLQSAADDVSGQLHDVHAPMRPPVLCSGCPHRGSFYAVKQALKKQPAVLCGDIGCYTLGNAMPLDAVDTCLCMGAGITIAQGISVADPGKKALAFIGDSTFFASGITGVVNAVYNQHDITIVILDNSTTAMTGLQPHPGTGQTLMGPHSDPISIEQMLNAAGVTCITHANPHFLEESVHAATEAISYKGPSAIIFKAPCMQLVRPEQPARVDTERCTGCFRCIERMGCPALAKDDAGTHARVDATLCAGCGLCADVCPFDAIDAPVRDAGRTPFDGMRKGK